MAGARGKCAAWLVTFLAFGAIVVSAAPAAVVRGKLREVIVDYRDGRSATRYLVDYRGHATRVRPVGAVKADSGDAVRVRGHWRDGSLKGRISPVRAAATTSAATPTRAEEGIRTLAVLLISFPEHPAEASPEAVRKAVFTDSNSTNAFYRFESFGEIGFTGIQSPAGDVFGPYELAGTTTTCPTEVQLKEAMATAEAEGIPISQYQNIVGAFPRASCRFSGLATGGRALLSGFITSPALYAHELGHNLSFGHAHSLKCVNASGEPVAIELGADKCTSVEYGDEFDVMGGSPSGPARSNDLYLKYLGVFKEANIETVMTPGAYTMRASLSDPSQVKFLRVPAAFNAKREVSLWYYLEIRESGSPFELNGVTTTQTGVSIRRAGSAQWSSTSLIDTNPQTTTVRDAPLASGHTFSDGNVTIETLSVANDVATVAITTPDWIDPSAPTGFEGHAGPQGVQLSWSPATDNVGVAGYWIYRDNTSLGHLPGTTTSFLDTTGSYGGHTYSVVAEDAAHNYSPETKAHFTFPDVAAPSAPASLQASLTAAGVQLSWGASVDNAGPPRYVVLRGGTKLGETAERSFLDSDLSPGTREYTVYAKDSAGNVSPAASISLTIAAAPVATVRPAPITPLDEGKRPAISFRRVPLSNGWTLLVVRVLNPPEIRSLELVIDGKRVASGDAALLKARWKQAPRSHAPHRAVVRLLTPEGDAFKRTFRFG